MKESHKFYKYAHFYSTSEVIELLHKNGFICGKICQTIFSNPEIMTAPDPVRDSYGQGVFVVISSKKLFKENKMKILFIINDAPYGTEKAYNH